MNDRAQASQSVSPRWSSEWTVRGQWLMFGLLAFISFESLLLAAVLKGPWLVLIAPGIACGMRALEIWRELRPFAAITTAEKPEAARQAADAPGRHAPGTPAPSMLS